MAFTEFDLFVDAIAPVQMMVNDPIHHTTGFWVSELYMYRFKIWHIPGIENQPADCLSRAFDMDHSRVPVTSWKAVPTIMSRELFSKYSEEKSVVVSKPLYNDIIANAKNNDPKATEIVLNSIEFNEAEFDDLDGTTLYDIVDIVLLLYKMNLAPLRPSNFEEIISALHEDHGHFGFTGVRHRLLACGYNWSNMTEDIKKSHT